jgi:hypothetical protein
MHAAGAAQAARGCEKLGAIRGLCGRAAANPFARVRRRVICYVGASRTGLRDDLRTTCNLTVCHRFKPIQELGNA